ncbi:hypothetical protein PHYPSEUDO_005648 [Phytophthora pseudosyringae]|uniref:Uncharacterized protein n=1 Tax=Phytophthora pseudosyringae TaxID=221518 RepID=A0A8T1VL26_9STRA|nr:hypothetical protein PHYPSEUDO_005648 [Phytophthora pseudosyringae]
MADASDDEADAMASVRMLYVMFTKLRQLAANGIPDSCARVPRLPAALAEADRPFNQTYCNRHAKVFRGNYRVNHHVVEICDAQITEPVRPTQTSSLAISQLAIFLLLGSLSNGRAVLTTQVSVRLPQKTERAILRKRILCGDNAH